MMNHVIQKSQKKFTLKLSHLLFALVFFMGTFVASNTAKAHSVAVFIEIETGVSNPRVKFHVLSWHSFSSPSGWMSVNDGSGDRRFSFAAVTRGPVPSAYRRVAQCTTGYGEWTQHNNSTRTYQSTGWISGINLCNTLSFNMSSNILETPACTLSGSVNLSTPVILEQIRVSPGTTFCSGTNYSMSIVANGVNLSYQWQTSTDNFSSNIVNVGGTNSSSYSAPTATLSDNNLKYRCIVTSNGSCGSPTATSNIVTLTITNGTSITTHPTSSVAVCAGASQSLSVAASGSNISYRWQESTDNGSNWNNLNNVAPYSGVTSATLNISGISVGMNNYRYRCVATGSCGSATSNASTLTVWSATSITAGPVTATACETSSASFSISADGQSLTYQWQSSLSSSGSFSNLSNNTIYSGVTASTLNITSTSGLGGRVFRCIVGGSCNPTSVTSSTATLNVNTRPAISTNPVSLSSVCSPGTADFSVATTGTNVNYVWQELANPADPSSSWTPVTLGGVYSVTSTSTSSRLRLTNPAESMHLNQYRCIVGSGTTPACGSSVTSTIGTLNVFKPATITSNPISSTVCEAATTTLSFAATGTALTYKWQVLTTSPSATWTDILTGSNYLNANTLTLTITGVPSTFNGFQYRAVALGSCGGPATSTVATLTVNALPRISSNPSSITICEGGTASFTATTSGFSPSFQWERRSGSAGTFADVTSGTYTSSTLIFNPTAIDNSYQYRLKISNACGGPFYSTPAILNVNTLPNITVSPVAASGCIYGRALFFLTNTGLGNTYRWEEAPAGTTSFTTLTDNKDGLTGFISMGTSTDSLKLSSLISAKNNRLYRCVVTSSGVCGGTSTETAPVALTVKERPSITTQPVNANNNLDVNNPSTLSYTFRTVAAGALSGTNVFQWYVSTNSGRAWSLATGSSGGITYSVDNTSSSSYSSVLSVIMPSTISVADRQRYLYRCLVIGECSTATTRIVNVNPPPKLNRSN